MNVECCDSFLYGASEQETLTCYTEYKEGEEKRITKNIQLPQQDLYKLAVIPTDWKKFLLEDSKFVLEASTSAVVVDDRNENEGEL